MQNFIQHTGTIVPLDASNIDTDILIPKQFLQKISKTGFGKYLFFNWRFLDALGNIENSKFILNQNNYRHASIMLTRNNFGCGSSREHAVWALTDYGFKAIIAHSFSDIFLNNALNNRLLLITVPEKEIDKLFILIKKNKNTICMINLLKEKVIIGKYTIPFFINPIYKQSIMYGFDNIDYTLKHKDKIELYEKKKKEYNFF
ncbi:3-isopropylmalate dehydratase small subunit [Buchnera aphidicola]|uniref:3-isopropylmalate dehydratase small subunit n=1 Tax=Buchnera aphidicola TaxID=9 RepID=UPI00094C0828|nr:3-isopropylmalate dehydratase small subunit [Buchnera aphidicola]